VVGDRGGRGRRRGGLRRADLARLSWRVRCARPARRPRLGDGLYDVTKLARWVALTAACRALGKGPDRAHRESAPHRPDVYHQNRGLLEPVDYLNLRLTGRARASFDSITAHWVTDNRDIGRSPTTAGLVKMAGLDPDRLPRSWPTGSVMGMSRADGPPVTWVLLAGTPVATGTATCTRPPLGSGRSGLRRAPFYIGNLVVDQLPRAVQAHVTDHQRGVDPLRSGGPLPGGQRARDGGRVASTGCSTTCSTPDDGLGAPRPDAALERLNEGGRHVCRRAPTGRLHPWLNGERSPLDDHGHRNDSE